MSMERARSVSLALSHAARQVRLQSRRRRLTGGETRRTRWVIIASFVCLVLVPTLASVAYFGFIATDQYVSEAEFTLSTGESPLRDGVEPFTSAPMLLLIQDAQILTSFIHSREIVDKLESRVGLRRHYSIPQADIFARLNPQAPAERLQTYWSHASSLSIKLPGGLMKLRVRAFSPQDAHYIVNEILALFEDLVNTLNTRINHDALALAQELMTRATERLTKALAAEETARSLSGVLDANLSARSVATLITELRRSLLSVSGAYNIQARDMNAKTPQMQALKMRIDVLQNQIHQLEGELTTKPALGTEETIASAMPQLSALEVERKSAEQLYANAATALEHARIAAEYQTVYLKIYAPPSLPQEATYPQRGLDIALTFLASLSVWGGLLALGRIVKNNHAL